MVSKRIQLVLILPTFDVLKRFYIVINFKNYVIVKEFINIKYTATEIQILWHNKTSQFMSDSRKSCWPGSARASSA